MRAFTLAAIVAMVGVAGSVAAAFIVQRLGMNSQSVLLATGAAGLLGLIAGLLFVPAVVGPLKAIGRVAHAIKDGAFEARVRGSHMPEVLALNDALDVLVRARDDAESRLAPMHADAVRREADLQRLLSAAQEGLWAYDDHAQSIALSRIARRLLDIPEGAKDSLAAFSAAIVPEEREGLLESFRHATRSDRTPVRREIRVVGNDGRPRTLLFRAVPREDEAHPIIAGSIVDVTAQRDLESALANANELFAGAELRIAQERARVAKALLANPGGPGDAVSLLAEVLSVVPPAQPSPEAFDPRALAEDAVVAAAGRARSMKAELVLEVDPGVPPLIRSDPRFLRRVLDLCLARALESPGPEVVVSVAHRRAELLTWVKDAGPGLPARVAADPADPFPDVVDGQPNLRLALAHRLVTSLGGRIGIETARGRGTTVLVAVSAEVVPVAVPALKPIQKGRLRGLRALIVDDNATSRRVLAQEAESWGLVHQEVASAEEALAALRKEPFDLALVDQGLPVADGFDLARRMRAIREKALSVVVLTTGDVDLDEADLHTLGIEGAVPKPLRSGRLYETLAGLTDRREFVGHGVEVASSTRGPVPAFEALPPPSTIEVRGLASLDRPQAPTKRVEASRAPRKTAVEPNIARPVPSPIPDANRAARPPKTRPSLFDADPSRLRPTAAASAPEPPTASRPKPLAALDPKILAKIRLDHGDVATADRLVSYVDRSTTHVAEMRGAIATGDATAFERAGRDLARMSRDVGAAQVASLADEFVTAVHAGRIDAVARRFIELENAHRHARRSIEVERRRPTL